MSSMLSYSTVPVGQLRRDVDFVLVLVGQLQLDEDVVLVVLRVELLV